VIAMPVMRASGQGLNRQALRLDRVIVTAELQPMPKQTAMLFVVGKNHFQVILFRSETEFVGIHEHHPFRELTIMIQYPVVGAKLGKLLVADNAMNVDFFLKGKLANSLFRSVGALMQNNHKAFDTDNMIKCEPFPDIMFLIPHDGGECEVALIHKISTSRTTLMATSENGDFFCSVSDLSPIFVFFRYDVIFTVFFPF
jgi:hypothetical protein